MYNTILVPIDGSPASQNALNEALVLAKQDQARLRLLHVSGLFVPLPTLAARRDIANVLKALNEGGRRVLSDAEELARRRGVEVDSALVETTRGRAADEIMKHAKKCRADLIVIGTHGRRGIDHLVLGSDAEKVIRISPVPVLVVHGGKKRRR